MSEWQPIHTAPDEEYVLVADEWGIQIAMRDENHQWWAVVRRIDQEDNYPIFDPSHWMPLPEPPKVEG